MLLRLEIFGVAPCHPSSEQTGCICVFYVTDENLDDVQYKSVYNKRLAKTTQFMGNTLWMLRLMVNKEGTGLIIYNAASESMIYEHELPSYPLEFALNKLLVTSTPSHMYLIIDWSTVKCIFDSNTANVKSFAFPMP